MMKGGWLVNLLIHDLALLATVGNFLADTTVQQLLWVSHAEVTGTNLLLYFLRTKTI